MSDNIRLLLHDNFPQAASSSVSSWRKCFSVSIKSDNSTTSNAIQKNSVQCNVGAVNFGTMLFAVPGWGTIYVSKNSNATITRFLFFYIGDLSNFVDVQFVVKPNSLLLEDQRSETRIERHTETVALFMKSVERNSIPYSDSCTPLQLNNLREEHRNGSLENIDI